MDRSIEEILKTLYKIVNSPEKLAYWTNAIENTAKSMSNDNDGKITFEYCPKRKS